MKHNSHKILVSLVSYILFSSFFLCFLSFDARSQTAPQAITPILSPGQTLPAIPVSPAWHSGNSTLCTQSPITVIKPYLGYNGIVIESQARTAWCQNESKEIITSYCTMLSDQLRATEVWTLGPDCQAAVLLRQQEYNEILAFLTP